MIGAMQANAEMFSDRSCLIELVKKQVISQWHTGWGNRLTVREADTAFHSAKVLRPDGPAEHRFHFLSVHNLHDRKDALDCVVFPTRLHKVGSTKNLLSAETELKWTGYTHPQARIRANSKRSFDAVVIPHNQPSTGYLHGFTDASDYFTVIIGPGKFEIDFEVTCANFARTVCRAQITLGNSIEESKIEVVECDGMRRS
jgi:hypothetical protein